MLPSVDVVSAVSIGSVVFATTMRNGVSVCCSVVAAVVASVVVVVSAGSSSIGIGSLRGPELSFFEGSGAAYMELSFWSRNSH